MLPAADTYSDQLMVNRESVILVAEVRLDNVAYIRHDGINGATAQAMSGNVDAFSTG
jgi:hypothetical protein